MAGTVKKENIKKLILAYNEAPPTGEKNFMHPPQFNGLVLGYDLEAWRLAHSEDFAAFCAGEKAHKLQFEKYEHGTLYLPAAITELVFQQTVTPTELEAFITFLIQAKDNQKKKLMLAIPS